MAKKTDTKSTKPEAKAETKPEAKAVALHVASGALQRDVGPLVIGMMMKADTDEAKIRDLTEAVNYYRGEAVGRLVHGIVSAYKADAENIVLSNVYSDKKSDKISLLDTVDIALGVKEVVEGELRYTEEVRKYFPPSKPSKAFKESDKFKRLRAFQANWTTAKRKGSEAALGIVENNIDVSFDEDAHALRISNAPKQIAGPSGAVTLTGEQVEGAQERASIDALRRLSAKAHGKATAQKGKATNGESLKQRALESEDAFGELCNSLIGAINGLEGTISEAQAKHLDAVYLAIGEARGY